MIYTPYICSFTIYTNFRYSNAISYTLIYRTQYRQLGYNRKGYKNRRKELEVVVLDSKESKGRDIEKPSSEDTTSNKDKLAQIISSSQFYYIIKLNKTSYFFLKEKS